MLTYGALASMDGASDAARAAAVAGLVQLEQQAKNEQRLTHWLHALGNTGSSDVFGAARPYLEHADPALRSAAADAVRGATTTEAREALARHALSDADTGVRKKCAAILADRSDAGSLATVRQVLEHEASVDVRRAAVDALARRVKTDANAKQLLIYVAGNDPSTELRAQAAAAL
jgi:HEAT repeat protein